MCSEGFLLYGISSGDDFLCIINNVPQVLRFQRNNDDSPPIGPILFSQIWYLGFSSFSSHDETVLNKLELLEKDRSATEWLQKDHNQTNIWKFQINMHEKFHVQNGYMGRDLVVIILDDGLERTHPDIKPNCVCNVCIVVLYYTVLYSLSTPIQYVSHIWPAVERITMQIIPVMFIDIKKLLHCLNAGITGINGISYNSPHPQRQQVETPPFQLA